MSAVGRLPIFLFASGEFGRSRPLWTGRPQLAEVEPVASLWAEGNMLVADAGRRVVLCDFDLSIQTEGTEDDEPWSGG